MQDLILTLTAIDPLVLVPGSARSMASECLGYIPGSLLLGAMAAHWKKANPGVIADDSPEFQELFLNGGISWGDGLPLCENEPTVPVPLCYHYIKGIKGTKELPTEGDDSQAERIVYNRAAIATDEELQNLYRNRYPDKDDTIKTRKIKPGFINPHTLHRAEDQRFWNIHVSLDKKRSAVESRLFGYSALAPGRKFQAKIIPAAESAEKALRKLTENMESIYVGQARSAGYGHVKLDKHWQNQNMETAPKGTVFSLFFLSRYLPAPSWCSFADSLIQEVSKLANPPGIAARILGQFTDFETINGYNAFWNRPRTSRTGLGAGTVVQIEFDREAALPREMRIGANQMEGCGRILCNPDFLTAALPVIAPIAPAEKSDTQADPLPDNSLVKLLRKRALARLKDELAEKWLHTPGWTEFIKRSARNPRPSASQRNNLRDITPMQFENMLNKTPGEQWKQTITYSPFDGRNDYLADIIKKLLDPEFFFEKTPGKKFTPDLALSALPGNKITQQELDKFKEDTHKLFIRLLVSAWTKQARLNSGGAA